MPEGAEDQNPPEEQPADEEQPLKEEEPKEEEQAEDEQNDSRAEREARGRAIEAKCAAAASATAKENLTNHSLAVVASQLSVVLLLLEFSLSLPHFSFS